MKMSDIGYRPLQNKRRELKREKQQDEKLIKSLISTLSSLEPDYSQSTLPPIEIKKTRFQYTPQDYSRLVECKTEDEIIASVLYPERNKHRRVTADEYAGCGPEVINYWKQKLADSLIRRGKAYLKVDGIVKESTLIAKK